MSESVFNSPVQRQPFLSKLLGFCSAAFLVHSYRSESHFRLVHTKLIWKDNNLHAKAAWQVWALSLSLSTLSLPCLSLLIGLHLRMQWECRLIRGPTFVMITLLFPSLSAIRELDRRLIYSGAKKKKNWQFLTVKVAPFSFFHSQPFLSLPPFLLSAFFLYPLPPIIFPLLPSPPHLLFLSPLFLFFSLFFCFLPLSPSFNIACPSLLPAFKLLPFTSWTIE